MSVAKRMVAMIIYSRLGESATSFEVPASGRCSDVLTNRRKQADAATPSNWVRKILRLHLPTFATRMPAKYEAVKIA